MAQTRVAQQKILANESKKKQAKKKRRRNVQGIQIAFNI